MFGFGRAGARRRRMVDVLGVKISRGRWNEPNVQLLSFSREILTSDECRICQQE
jgi:hypothetical protein